MTTFNFVIISYLSIYSPEDRDSIINMSLIKKYLRKLKYKINPTAEIVSYWQAGGKDFKYYEVAEQQEHLDKFWNQESIFYKLFQNLNLDRVLEIACGTGRHSAIIVDKVNDLYLLDSSESALELAKKRFSNYPKITYIHNQSGFGIPEKYITRESLTAIFSYDAMVHFEPSSVHSYLKDSFKLLQSNGLALFHHSNYDKNIKGKFSDNPGWRNYMSKEIFTKYCEECGFIVLESEIISFCFEDSDCLTLLKKP